MKQPISALLGLTLLLAACGQSGVGNTTKRNPPPVGQPLNTNTDGSYNISGNVTFSGALSASSVDAQGLSPQQALAASDWDAPHVEGAVLLRKDLNSLRSQSSTVLAGLNAHSVGEDLTLVQTSAGNEQAVASRLAAAGYVTQPNYVYQLQAVVNDPGWPENNGIQIGNTLYDQDYLTRINVADAWNVLGQKNAALRSGVKVAVLDTGVNANHPDLAGHVLLGRNFSTNLPDGTSDTSDSSSNAHGTSTAGLIAASTNNGQGIAGVTWGGQILPVKVFDANGQATTASLAAGVNYAVQQGARVINMSLGFTGKSQDGGLADAINKAKLQNRVVIASAGNTPNNGLYYPASDPNVIAVGATYQPDPQNSPSTEAVACYSAQPSSGQKAVDIYAPGGPGGKPDTSGQKVTPCGDQNYNILSLGPNNGYQLITGTSEAAPQVSGAVSLMLAAKPDLTVDQVRSILASSGRSFAGGKFLNVGAAVRQALGVGGGSTPTPPSNSASYYVTLAVSQSGGLIGQGTGTVEAGATGLPFEASLAAGTYTFQAKVFKNGQQIQQGSQTVTVPASTSVTVKTQ